MAQQPPVTGNVPVAVSSGGGQYGSLFANLMNKRTKAEYATLGTPYLFEYWTTGTVDIDGQTYVLEQVKLDLIEKALEVIFDGEQKYIDAYRFTRFTLYDQEKNKAVYFTNSNLYKVGGKRLDSGIMKVTQVGEYNILTHMRARLVHPSQAQLINGVDPRPKVVKENFLYLEHDGVVLPIRKKKDLEKALRRHQGKLKRYMKENKVNVKNEADLMGLLIYIQQ
ncbi:MAG: hypothetical protein Kow0027_28080 [Saprospiraceae bacterium]